MCAYIFVLYDVFMYLNTHMLMYVGLHTCIHICICTHEYTHTHAYIYLPTYVHKWISTYAYMHTQTELYMNVSIHT